MGDTAQTIWKIIFWLCLGATVYTYFLYPLLIYIIGRMTLLVRVFKANRGVSEMFPIAEADLPTVTMVISAFNEENVLPEKIANCLALDYPRGKLNFLIGSDGSTDRTGAILETIQNDRFHTLHNQYRSGKVRMLNQLMPMVKSDIVVFSDANTLFRTDAVRRLIQHFREPRIGCVNGKLELVSAEGNPDTCQPEGLYWRYENWIKQKESHLGVVPTINGGIFAIRRHLFQKLPDNAVTEDQVQGMKIMTQGYRCKFADDAHASETISSWTGELRRRIRISAGNFQSLLLVPKILDPRCGWVSFCFISHKLLRWLVPFFLAGILTANLILAGQPFYGSTLLLQSVFYLTGIIGTILPKLGSAFKILSVPKYFITMNIAIFLGLTRFLAGRQQVTWKKAAR